VFETLGLLDSANGEITADIELQAASDAEIDINGITGITSSTNTFSEAVEGVTFNIDPEADIDSTATVSVEKDTGKATKAVQAFVDQYNSVMNFIDSKSGYDSETEKAGILQGDGTIMRLQMRLRELVTSKIKNTGSYQSLGSIGIEIDRDGVMSLDSSKLTDALDNSPEETVNLFQAESDSEGYDGMAVRMDSYLDQVLQSNTGLIPRRLDFYDSRIDGLNDNIEDVQRRVEMTRQRYVDQFAAMEEAISEMQSQQSWMFSQLQSMGGSTSSSMI
jgi:flagellar hook-associated protein 2